MGLRPLPFVKQIAMDERDFKGVWIPAEVWLNSELTLTEKALLAEIDSFSGNGKTFYKSNETIVEEYQVSRSTIGRAVKKLEKMGYIDVRNDGRSRHLTSRVGRVIKMRTQNHQNDESAASKRGHTNTVERKVERTLKEEELVMPFDSEKFRDAWSSYLEMRKAQHRFTYKTHASEQTALHQLYKISNGNENTAVAIIAQSIAWCWKGLFPLKQTKNEQQIGTTDGSVIEAHLRNLGAQS